MFEYVIYGLEDVESGRMYVGCTNDILRRYKTHIQQLRSQTHHNRRLQDYFDENGADGLKLRVLGVENIEERALAIEQYLIAYYASKKSGTFNETSAKRNNISNIIKTESKPKYYVYFRKNINQYYGIFRWGDIDKKYPTGTADKEQALEFAKEKTKELFEILKSKNPVESET